MVLRKFTPISGQFEVKLAARQKGPCREFSPYLLAHDIEILYNYAFKTQLGLLLITLQVFDDFETFLSSRNYLSKFRDPFSRDAINELEIKKKIL